MTSGVSLGKTLRALQLSATCSGLEAPRIQVETFSFYQARIQKEFISTFRSRVFWKIRAENLAHLDSPSQSQMGHRAVQLLLGDIRQLPDLFNLCLSLGALELFHGILEELGVGRVSGILGDLSRVVFSGQLSGGKVSAVLSLHIILEKPRRRLTKPLAKGLQIVVPNPL